MQKHTNTNNDQENILMWFVPVSLIPRSVQKSIENNSCLMLCSLMNDPFLCRRQHWHYVSGNVVYLCMNVAVRFVNTSPRRAESDRRDSLVRVVRLHSNREEDSYNCLQNLRPREGFWHRRQHSWAWFGFPKTSSV